MLKALFLRAKERRGRIEPAVILKAYFELEALYKNPCFLRL